MSRKLAACPQTPSFRLAARRQFHLLLAFTAYYAMAIAGHAQNVSPRSRDHLLAELLPSPAPTALEHAGLLPTLVNAAQQVTYEFFVAPHGNDSGVCSENMPCATLVRATVLASVGIPETAGAVIRMAAGRYGASSCGALLSRAHVVVMGSGATNTTIDCAYTARALFTTFSVTIMDLTFENGVSDDEFGGGALAVVFASRLVELKPTVTLRNVYFLGNNNAATALGGAVSIMTFIGSTVGLSISILGCYFEGNGVASIRESRCQ